jgi:chemotaxis protein MotA
LGESPPRLLVLLGGDFPAGIIQIVTYFLFFIGIFEIYGQLKWVKNQNEGFYSKLLPEKENWVLSPQDVSMVRLQALDVFKQRNLLLADLIRKACEKYRSDKSPADSLAVLSAQVKINISNSESEQSLARYVIWAIPSVGFIGTVIGISASLGFAGEANTPEGIIKITTTLSIAFDTTLVSLFLSLILMYIYHDLQEKIEKFHNKSEEYIIENLINRIYHS